MALKTALILFVLFVGGFLAYVRFAASDPGYWHVDPLTAKKPRSRNYVFILSGDAKYPAPEFDLPAPKLAEAFDRFITADALVARLAGHPDELFVTYLVRTPVMRYPDYVSVRFIDLDEGRSTLAMFSRSRFGYSDRNMNKRRATGWFRMFDPLD